MFLSFINELQEQLSGTLPGKTVQFEMASADRKINPPDLTKITNYRESAVCILLYEKDDHIYFPLIERSSYEGVHSAQIALPGGKVENETSESAAIRELHEEIGYTSKNITILGKLTDVYIPPSNFLVHPYIAYTNEIPEFSINPREVEKLIIYKLVDILNDDIIKQTEIEPVKGYKIKAPYFDVQGKILWGATAMMLNELKHLLKENSVIASFQSP